jgi:hypothetical protein
MTQPNPLLQAAEHLQAGRIDQARAILIALVRQNPNSEKGWLLLSRTLNDRKQQTDCLERVLAINPNNTEARERLTQLSPPPAAPLPKVSAFTLDGMDEMDLSDFKPTPTPTRPPPAPVTPPTPLPQPRPPLTDSGSGMAARRYCRSHHRFVSRQRRVGIGVTTGHIFRAPTRD